MRDDHLDFVVLSTLPRLCWKTETPSQFFIAVVLFSLTHHLERTFFDIRWLTKDFSTGHIICIGLLGLLDLLSLKSQDTCLRKNDRVIILLAIAVSILDQRRAANQIHHVTTASVQICVNVHKIFGADKAMRESCLWGSRHAADPIRPALGHDPSEVYSFVDDTVKLLGKTYPILAGGGVS